MLNSKAGLCISALFDSKPTLSADVSPDPTAHLLKFDLLVNSFLGHCGKNYDLNRLEGRIQEAGLHEHSPNGARPPGKYSNSGLDPKQFKPHIVQLRFKDEKGNMVSPRIWASEVKKQDLLAVWPWASYLTSLSLFPYLYREGNTIYFRGWL